VSELKGLICDTCKTTITWILKPGDRITKGVIQQKAREEGWQAPCKDGRDLCGDCRRPDGKARAAQVVARNKARREQAREDRIRESERKRVH
jgi:hypothetical protein